VVYELQSISHPLLDRRSVKSIKEERPTGNVILFVEPSTSREKVRELRERAAAAFPNREIIVSVRAPLATPRPVRLRKAG
jgi:hypothetical protein